jgi:medium-chain acyl-[acyl-carrier-protein] hydrolase
MIDASKHENAKADRWIGPHLSNAGARVRLFCFPFAGGGASTYRDWGSNSEEVEVLPLELPGRETRCDEPPIADVGVLVSALAAACARHADRPFALFGHSMGALLAFEVAHALIGRGLVARHVFVSGRQPPDQRAVWPAVQGMSDDELVAFLRALGGTSRAVLNNRELMAILLPLLRADFRIAEAESDPYRRPLPCPLTVFGGLDDSLVPPTTLDGWRTFTVRRCRVELLGGGHFFITSAKHELQRRVLAELRAAMAGERQHLS